jgi:hypothetical protein
MFTSSYRYSDPGETSTTRYWTSDEAGPPSPPSPPRDTSKKPRNVLLGYGSSSSHSSDAENWALLPNRLQKRGASADCSSGFAILVIALFLCPVLYFLYWYALIPAEVRYYKGLYDVASTEVTHLGGVKLALEGRVGALEGELGHYKGLYLDVQIEAQRLEKENGAGEPSRGTGGQSRTLQGYVRRCTDTDTEPHMGEVHFGG